MKTLLRNCFKMNAQLTLPEKVVMLMIVFMVSVLSTNAQLTGYAYRDAIKVQENSGTQKVNYQILLEMDTEALVTAGKMQATGNDIRFSKNCNGSTLYNYFIESGINTSTTKIWVQIDTLVANGDRTFYMFYGNPTAAAASNFTTTFPLNLTVSAGSVTLTGTNNYDWFEIASGATVIISPNSPFVINARVIKIAGTLNGNGAGYLGGNPGFNGSGPGNGKVSTGNLGTYGAGGAGYGGPGGNGGGAGAAATSANVGQAGIVYGTMSTDTIEMGSGGGGAASGGQGGAGGAGITLNGDYVTVTGLVSANGGDGVTAVLNGAGGAGSGGGIRIKGHKVILSGNLSANGGNGAAGGYGSGGGGGGRIKIFSDASLVNTAFMYVNGGAAGTPNGETVPQAAGTAGTTFTGTYTSNIPTYMNMPHVTLSASANPICAGDNVIFTASSGFNNYLFQLGTDTAQSGAAMTWSSSTLIDNDTVTVLASDVNSCIDTSNVILMDVNTVPVPTITQSGTTLSSSSATGNQWYFNGTLIPGATGQDYTAMADGSYTVEVTSGSCTAMSSPYAYTSTGISAAESEAIHVYPNPGSGMFILNVSRSEDAVVRVYNTLGKEVASLLIKGESISPEGKVTLNLESLSDGIYMMILHNAEGQFLAQKKIIIEK